MRLGSIVLYKGKPVKIFGSKKEDGKLTHWCVAKHMGRGRVVDYEKGCWVPVGSKDLEEIKQ